MYRLGSLRNSNTRFYTKRKLQWTNDPIKVLGVTLSNDKSELIKFNLDSLIQKSQAILKMWTPRGLSLYGKISVINTLIISMFTYRLSVILALPVSYLEVLNKMFADFIWSGSKAKIKLRVLQGLKTDGGAGLTNLKNKDMALKCQWVSKIFQNDSIKTLAYELLANPIGDEIWKATLCTTDIKKMFKDSFWRDVLISWSTLSYDEPIGKTQVLNQLLWCNSLIRVAGSPTINRSWIKQGMKYVRDIVTSEGNFKTQEQIENEYNIKIMFTEYQGIIKAIPKIWKSWLVSHEPGCKQKDYFKLFSNLQKPVGPIYRDFCQVCYMIM